MRPSWLLLPAASVPAEDEWLGPEEQRVVSGLRFPKRRSDWRLGRFTAKRALSMLVELGRLDRCQIIAAEDGAPEAFLDGRPMGISISISHRKDTAVCVLGSGMTVGCDLEAIEPRTERFVADYFTDTERQSLPNEPGALRDRQVALTWSAKESALKVLRAGLRRDTRSVQVELEHGESCEAAWQPLKATLRPEGRQLQGWWRQEQGLVLTVVCDDSRAWAPAALGVAGHDEER